MGRDTVDFLELRASSANLMPQRLGTAPTEPLQSLTTGASLGPYKVIERLGSGATGEVFTARDERDGTIYATKVLRKGNEAEELIRERIAREAHAIARINSEYVVRLQDYFELLDGRLVIVMEHAAGKNLRHVNAEDSLTYLQKLTLLERIATGLASVHALGIVHRDLKPSNIVVEPLDDGSLHPRIVDFGIAFSQSDMRITLGFVGTPAYCCPEQAMARPLDAKSDIYSLGVVAWELLMGRTPFVAEKPYQLLEMQVNASAPPLEWDHDIRPAGFDRVSALVGQMLSKEPTERPTSMAKVAAQFATAREEAWRQVTAQDDAPNATFDGWERSFQSSVAEKEPPFFAVKGVRRIPSHADSGLFLLSEQSNLEFDGEAVRLFDNTTKEEIASYPSKSTPLALHLDRDGAFLVWPDGFYRMSERASRLAAPALGQPNDITAIVRDPSRGRIAIARTDTLWIHRTAESEAGHSVSFPGPIRQLALSQVDAMVLVETQSELVCFDIADELTIRWRIGLREHLASLAFSGDGYLLASLNTQGVAKIRSVIDGSLLAESNHPDAVAVSFDSAGNPISLELIAAT